MARSLYIKQSKSVPGTSALLWKAAGQQGGFGLVWCSPGAGGGRSLPWLTGGFWSHLSFQAVPGGCHVPRGPEGAACARLPM